MLRSVKRRGLTAVGDFLIGISSAISGLRWAYSGATMKDPLGHGSEKPANRRHFFHSIFHNRVNNPLSFKLAHLPRTVWPVTS
jgi:hypothetical protein